MSNNGEIRLAVFGAHLTGMPLNHELTDRGAILVVTTRTASRYRFFALDSAPPKPGLVRVESDGAEIDCEVWELSAEAFGSFVNGVPHPLGIGKVELADGAFVNGFICEQIGIKDAQDITAYGSWKTFVSSK